MATSFQLTPERVEKIETYNRIGWPNLMTISLLELYTQTSQDTLRSVFLSRDDAPFIKYHQRALILKKWTTFIQSVK
ncbi:hypothetical protein [Leuconostoc mesenteroides]|uniref:hypothetical protein n=1 Tax=Leuconostoc mesenteroides TaxID=1245 RepID=UPI0011276516|nr:hypothetical protein [Leuconostoc mesenteroides]TPF01403.1 hypothetical protein DIS10_07815 [Leuconostoc mesenteroides]